MTRLLIIYATTEGQTEKIAGYIAGRLRAKGAVVDTTIAEAVPAELDLAEYDAVIVGGSVHLGRYQRELVDLVKNRADTLNQLPAGFYSVSASAASPEGRADVEPLLQGLFDKTGWRPAEVANLAGAVRYLHYGPITRYVMKRISAHAGGGTDTSKEYEYTSWDEVDAFADRMLAVAAARSDAARG